MKPFPLDRVYQLIEPGPVVLLATAFDGKPNVMTMSWHMMMEFVPPRIGCLVFFGLEWFRDILLIFVLLLVVSV